MDVRRAMVFAALVVASVTPVRVSWACALGRDAGAGACPILPAAEPVVCNCIQSPPAAAAVDAGTERGNVGSPGSADFDRWTAGFIFAIAVVLAGSGVIHTRLEYANRSKKFATDKRLDQLEGAMRELTNEIRKGRP